MPEHFAGPPHWDWYILFYFFFGGISGGAYTLGTLLRLRGDPEHAGGAKTAFLVSWPLLLLCPVLLTLDLGAPARFWHMLFDAGNGGIVFKYWSPMSAGAWVLALFGIFSTVSFVEALGLDGRLGRTGQALAGGLRGAPGQVFMVVGSALGLFIAGYTGVLLSVSNQPIWSDSWVLGGLFLASGLSSAAATIGLVGYFRRDTQSIADRLGEADAYFIVMELILVALFLLTLGQLASPIISGGFGVLFWLVAVVLGMAVPLASYSRLALTRAIPPAATSGLVLAGVLVLRGVVIFGAQG